jgi:phage RecT family recombinase
MNAAATKPKSATAVATPVKGNDLAVLEREIIKVLPEHVGPAKFIRVVATALNSHPEWSRNRDTLMSLYQAALKCAQDGLLPDGREAAFVVFKTKDRATGRYVEKVQYMPMIFGVLKKIRNSGELGSLICNVVLKADTFRHWVDDAGEHITHEPNHDAEARGKFKAVYAIAKTKDGNVYTEVMTKEQVDQVRAISKSKDDGPWVDWFDEMARKTVLRRLSKRLPMSTDIERTIQRDDDTYEVKQRTERSGVDAARSLLGLTQDASADTDDAPPLDSAPAAVEPRFTEDDALVAVAEATTVDALKTLWVDIADSYFDAGQEIPVKLEAAYGDRLATLKDAAAGAQP